MPTKMKKQEKKKSKEWQAASRVQVMSVLHLLNAFKYMRAVMSVVQSMH